MSSGSESDGSYNHGQLNDDKGRDDGDSVSRSGTSSRGLDEQGSYCSDENSQGSCYSDEQKSDDGSHCAESHTQGSGSQYTDGSAEIEAQYPDEATVSDDENALDDNSLSDGSSCNSQEVDPYDSEEDEQSGYRSASSQRSDQSYANGPDDCTSGHSPGSYYSTSEHDKDDDDTRSANASGGSYYSDNEERSRDGSQASCHSDDRHNKAVVDECDDRSASGGSHSRSSYYSHSLDSRGSYYSDVQHQRNDDYAGGDCQRKEEGSLHGSQGSCYSGGQKQGDQFADGSEHNSHGSYYSEENQWNELADQSEQSQGSNNSGKHGQRISKTDGSAHWSQGSSHSKDGDRSQQSGSDFDDGSAAESYHSSHYSDDQSNDTDALMDSRGSFISQDQSARSRGSSFSGDSGQLNRSGRSYNDDERTFDFRAESESCNEGDSEPIASESYSSGQLADDIVAGSGSEQNKDSLKQETHRSVQTMEYEISSPCSDTVGSIANPFREEDNSLVKSPFIRDRIAALAELRKPIVSPPSGQVQLEENSLHKSPTIRERIAALERRGLVIPVSTEKSHLVTPERQENGFEISSPYSPVAEEEHSISYGEALLIPAVDLLSVDGSVSIAAEESDMYLSQSNDSFAKVHDGECSDSNSEGDKSYFSKSDGCCSNSHEDDSYCSRDNGEGEQISDSGSHSHASCYSQADAAHEVKHNEGSSLRSNELEKHVPKLQQQDSFISQQSVDRDREEGTFSSSHGNSENSFYENSTIPVDEAAGILFDDLDPRRKVIADESFCEYKSNENDETNDEDEDDDDSFFEDPESLIIDAVHDTLFDDTEVNENFEEREEADSYSEKGDKFDPMEDTSHSAAGESTSNGSVEKSSELRDTGTTITDAHFDDSCLSGFESFADTSAASGMNAGYVSKQLNSSTKFGSSGGAIEASMSRFEDYARDHPNDGGVDFEPNNSFNEADDDQADQPLSPSNSFGVINKGDFFGNESFQSNHSGKADKSRASGSQSERSCASPRASQDGSYASDDERSRASSQASHVSSQASQGVGSYASGQRSNGEGSYLSDAASYISGDGSYASGDDGSYLSGQSLDEISHESDEHSNASGERSYDDKSHGSQAERSYASAHASGNDSYASGHGMSCASGQASQCDGSYVSDDRSFGSQQDGFDQASGGGERSHASGEDASYVSADNQSYVLDQVSLSEGSYESRHRSNVSKQNSNASGDNRSYISKQDSRDEGSYDSGERSYFSGHDSNVSGDQTSYVSGQKSQSSYLSAERSSISKASRGDYSHMSGRSSRSRRSQSGANDLRRGGSRRGDSNPVDTKNDKDGQSDEENTNPSDDEAEEAGPALKLPKPKTYGGYSREQMAKIIVSARSVVETAADHSAGKKKQFKGKSDSLLDLVEDVRDAMFELERLQKESDAANESRILVSDHNSIDQVEADEAKSEATVVKDCLSEEPGLDANPDKNEGIAKDSQDDPKATETADNFDTMRTSTRLLYAFEALVGILLQLSDELELLLTFSTGKDSPAIDALDALLSYTETIGDSFAILSPILLFYQNEEIDEELDDFLYGMNLVIDLLCELSNRVGERQQWNARANASFATLLELLARDTLEVSCIYEDIDTPDYELSDIIQDAWEETGHVEEIKTLLVTNDLFMFRQICYEVILSSDQWCPDNNTLMDICGVDDESEHSQMKPGKGDMLSPPPEAALQILEKIHGDPLRRTPTLASALRRLLPAQAITDPAISENFARIRNTIRNPLGMPPSSLVAITSFPESMDDPESLGVAGVGKTTLAAMVADHEDVRRFFNDGIAWIYVGEAELNYNRYVQCLQDLLSQLEVKEDEEPLFPELLHSPGDSPAKRRRREEGFMIYLRETMVEFLRFRNVLVILDDVCFEPDLDWFDFAPAPLPPDEEEEEEEEGSCAVLITSRRRDMLPPADTVEVDMLTEDEAIDLLMKESGELSRVLKRDAPELKPVVLECACHPLTVKSVARWLNLKHASAGVGENLDEVQENVVNSLDKILNSSLEDDSDMTYEILGMSLSPSINGEPTSIIKVCFAAFVRVFCERKHISDFALADSTPIVPLVTTALLFESLLNLEEEQLLKEGSLFHSQKKEAATLIPEALSALGIFKVIITYAEAPEGSSVQEEEDEKYLQVMHRIHQEYGEYLYEEDESLMALTKDGERRWNKAFSKAFLSRDVRWDIESPDAGQDYALEMLPSHMMRGGMLAETGKLLADEHFVRGRLFALGRENGTRRHIKDCEALFSLLKEKRSRNHKKIVPKEVMRAAYATLGTLLPMDEEEYIEEEGSPEAVEVGRCHFEIGFSLAEKRCWDGAIAHWEKSQHFLVSSLGMVEFVAGILYNIAIVYSEMHEYEQALASLRQCLRIRGAIHGEEHILYAQTIQKIGDVFLMMSDYQEAMESYNWALDVMHIEPSHHRIDIGDILEQMGKIHYSKGEIVESLQSFQDALRSKQVDLGEDHPELASLFHHIGNCLSNQGRTDEAIAHLEEAIRLKQLDPDGAYERDSDVLTIEGILSNITGKPQEGLTCYEKALQVLVTKVPQKKEKVASLLHLIGCVYLMSGEHKKAMKLFEESLHARRKVLGFLHLDVASTLFNMAFLHQTRNRLDKALKCLEEALKIRELRLPDSEKVAVTQEKIGNLARGIGKTKKAENAFTEALRIRKVVHGNSHVAVAAVLQELGDLTDDLGQYEDAMKYYVEALEIRENLLGPDDLAVAETYYSMGFTLQNNGALDRALQCLEESLSIRRFQLGDDAKDVGDTLNMMGFLQAKRGELDDALSLLWDALRIRKLLGDNIKVSETLNNIGNVHREKQEYDLAIECYEECLRIRRAELGDENEKVADALIAMGNVQSDMDYTDDAMDSYKEALAIRTMLFGEQDGSVATVLQYMGTLEFRANELDRAFQLLDEFIRIRQENGTEPDGDYVNVLFMIGNIHKMLGGEEEAKKCWTEAYGVFKKLGLAETNPQIAEVMSNLVKDEDVDGGSEKQNGGEAKKSKSVLGRFTAKVKSAARTANEAGIVVKKATGIKSQDRGSQLL